MSEVVIIAEAELAAGREEEALAVLADLCEQTHAKDDGCLLYAVHRVVGDERRIILVEKWRSREDLDRHIDSDHVAAKRKREAELFVGATTFSFVEPAGFGIASMASF